MGEDETMMMHFI